VHQGVAESGHYYSYVDVTGYFYLFLCVID